MTNSVAEPVSQEYVEATLRIASTADKAKELAGLLRISRLIPTSEPYQLAISIHTAHSHHVVGGSQCLDQADWDEYCRRLNSAFHFFESKLQHKIAGIMSDDKLAARLYSLLE